MLRTFAAKTARIDSSRAFAIGVTTEPLAASTPEQSPRIVCPGVCDPFSILQLSETYNADPTDRHDDYLIVAQPRPVIPFPQVGHDHIDRHDDPRQNS